MSLDFFFLKDLGFVVCLYWGGGGGDWTVVGERVVEEMGEGRVRVYSRRRGGR